VAWILPHVYVLLALPFLQAQVQLLAVVLLVLHRAARDTQHSAAPEHAVPKSSPDVDALLNLPSEDVEIGLLADVEANSSHLVDAA